jgi:hypothetical protein
VARSRLGIGEAEFLEFPDPCLVLFINQCFTSNMNLVTSFVGRLFDAFMLLRPDLVIFMTRKQENMLRKPFGFAPQISVLALQGRFLLQKSGY